MRRVFHAVWRRLVWSLVRSAIGSVTCYVIAGLLIAGVGVRSAPVLTAFDIAVGLVYLDVVVAAVRAWLWEQSRYDTDDQVDIKFLRPVPRRLRTLVFAVCAIGVITVGSGVVVLAAARAGQQLLFTLVYAGIAATRATYGLGKGLAERALSREKADRLLSRQRMAEVVAARTLRASRHPPLDPDAATRRRIAERMGARNTPSLPRPAVPPTPTLH